MADIKTVVSENIIKFRKKRNMTQLALADKIHYSDKAVSRWENAEVLPDVETLARLADIFNVDISAFFQQDADIEKISRLNNAKKNSRVIISLLAICAAWILATIIHVSLNVSIQMNIWQIYIYAIPVSFIIGVVFSSLWGGKNLKFFCISALVWSLTLTLYIIFLNYNIWPVFLVGIPLQVAIILWSRL